MSEDEILSHLDKNPLPRSAAQRVCLSILSRLCDISEFERFIFSEQGQGFRDLESLQGIWERLDDIRGKSDPKGSVNARARLFWGVTPSPGVMDGHEAEYVIGWTSDIGLNERVALEAIENEIKRH